MIAKQEIHQRLVLIESKLHDRPEVAGEVRALLQMLDNDERDWIDTGKAQRILGVHSDFVEGWVERGWLRSQRLPNGQVVVSLEDVIAERERIGALSLFGLDGEMTEEQYELAKRPAPPDIEEIVQELVRKSLENAAARGNPVSE